MTQTKSVSLRVADQVKGGGASIEGVGTIVEARFTPWDYQGKGKGAGKSVTALRLTIEQEGAEKPYVQYYSAGSPNEVIPSVDGKRLEAAPGKEWGGVNDNTVLAFFLQHLHNAGFDTETEFGDGGDVTTLEGESFEFKPTERQTVGGDKVKTTVPVRRGPKGSVTATAGPAKIGTPLGADALKEKLDGIVIGILSEAGDGLSKPKLSQAVSKAMAADTDRTAAVKLLLSEAYLKSLAEQGITFDGKVVKL